jgi:leucyl-tRNA synthetase
MSKSKNNGVDPQALIDKYGADTARFFIIFASPPTNTLEWSDEGVEGSYRFLKRLWAYAQDCHAVLAATNRARGKGRLVPPAWKPGAKPHDAFRHEIHSLLRQANYDLEKHQFNTVASAGMKLLNAIAQFRAAERAPDAVQGEWQLLLTEATGILIRLLSPITPHVAHHLWRELGYGEDVLAAPWPDPDPAALEQEEVELVVQVNGKLRGSIRVPKAADRGAIEGLALANPNVQKFVAGQSVKKVVVVPGRLVNLVV